MDDTTILGHFDLGSVLSPARAPRPRRPEGTHPDRLSILRNVETPMGAPPPVSRPGGKSPAGGGGSEKRKPAAERHRKPGRASLTGWTGPRKRRRRKTAD